MLLTLILLYAVFDSSASESIPDTSPNVPGEKRGKANQGALSFIASINNNLPPVNRTYYDKEINPLRVPNKFYEGRKKKNKITKSPKRTIQKIIKNGRSKSRKIYVHPVTRQPTVPPADEETKYTNTQRNVESRAQTQHLHRHKPKKPSKVVRYQMPFHKFPKKDNMNLHKRNRRDVDRDDVFIIKDLDEVEFLSKEEDNDVVKAHVQNYW